MKITMTTLALALALGACGKVQEAATEKVAQKMIESAISKDGTQAKVDLSSGGAKITTTDASGKTMQMEMGGAKVTEADVGVPFYPGTKLAEGQATRVTTPDGSSVTVGLRSGDASDKVVAFYRDKLKAQAEGRQLMDMSAGDGNYTLMLADEKSKGAIQVHVMKADKGTNIQIVSTRSTAK